ncbi:hypothetical protein QYE76_015682 [Lolium multiflorum]|uniref:Uncharacterized protein n=1 Tax=Lolium multiflorum TaxID=4521 RepID=A0AAD8U7B1_LOLMU|nr:hypothetical protein QYE76_015682 [Lolium multiflorum]
MYQVARCSRWRWSFSHSTAFPWPRPRSRPVVLEPITATGRPAFPRRRPVFPLPAVVEPLHGVPVAVAAPAAGGPRANHRDRSPAFPRPCLVFPPPAPTKTTPGRKSIFPVASLLVTSLSCPHPPCGRPLGAAPNRNRRITHGRKNWGESRTAGWAEDLMLINVMR